MILRLLYTTIASFVFLIHAEAQVVTGTVRASRSDLPLPFANVFFSNTTTGTTTDSLGRFHLNAPKAGHYSLVVSMVGYRSFMQEININESDNIRIHIRLDEHEELKEVIVKADTSGWKYNLKLFKDQFFGKMKGSSDCIIVNPRDLHFYYDPKDNVLVAHTLKPLRIENQHLGYAIEFWLEEFTADFRNKSTRYYGYPKFDHLLPKNRRQMRKWKQNRLGAYKGSMMELMRAFYQNMDIDSVGWRIHKITYVKNDKRPPKKLIASKIAQNLFNQDSLEHYLKLKREPEYLALLSPEPFPYHDYLKKGNAEEVNFTFTGHLQLVYEKEHQEPGFYSVLQNYKRNPQSSIVHFQADSFKIHSNGLVIPQDGLMYSGYLGWYEKVSTMLPLDYMPPVPVN